MAINGVLVLALTVILALLDLNFSQSEVKGKLTDSDPGLAKQNVPPLEEGNKSSLGKVPPNIDSPKLKLGNTGEMQDGGGLSEQNREVSEQNNAIRGSGSIRNHEAETHGSGDGKNPKVSNESVRGASHQVGSDPHEVPKEDIKDHDPQITKSLRKDNTRTEQCDESNRCEEKNSKLVACLRVPGNESPDLSLLIQNKGTRSLQVNITSPDYVQLEQTIVQLHEKEDKKVKVSIGNGSNETILVLATDRGLCKLDLRDMLSSNFGPKMEYSSFSTYYNLLTSSSALFCLIAVLLLMGAAWAYTIFRRRHESPRYQKLDSDLPVSVGGRMETNISDGWDDGWGDSWDDEEAPVTPSKPISNLSFQGLASRRYNKDVGGNSWKD